jgi:hypothetical protein
MPDISHKAAETPSAAAARIGPFVDVDTRLPWRRYPRPLSPTCRRSGGRGACPKAVIRSAWLHEGSIQAPDYVLRSDRRYSDHHPTRRGIRGIRMAGPRCMRSATAHYRIFSLRTGSRSWPGKWAPRGQTTFAYKPVNLRVVDRQISNASTIHALKP